MRAGVLPALPEGWIKLRDGWVVSGDRAEHEKEYNMIAKKKAIKERPVIVTTAHKGVFFGYAGDIAGEQINLRGARLCVYWSAHMHGFMGLASQGPSSGCRIGPAADITLRDITSVVMVTPEAEQKWLGATWK